MLYTTPTKFKCLVPPRETARCPVAPWVGRSLGLGSQALHVADLSERSGYPRRWLRLRGSNHHGRAPCSSVTQAALLSLINAPPSAVSDSETSTPATVGKCSRTSNHPPPPPGMMVVPVAQSGLSVICTDLTDAPM